MTAYTHAYNVRQELAIGSGADAIDDQWDRALEAMAEECSRLIDWYCIVEENAFAATASATRYVDGNGRTELWLPWPAVSVSAVSVEESDGTYTAWTQGTDYYRWPYQDDSGLTINPILRLDVNAKSDGSKASWTAGQKRVKVTAVFGITATPPELVERACKQQVAQWYKLASHGWSDTGGSPDFGELQYPRKLDASVMKLLGPYRRYA